MINGIKKSWYRKYLACPDCKADLHVEKDIHCQMCSYDTSLSIPIEIKPKMPENLSVKLSKTIVNQPIRILESVELSGPEITYQGPAALRDSRELMSEISRYLSAGSSVLDLGCGARDQAIPINFLKYRYVGIDYTNSNADFLADAHAIPFKESTFDCVLSYAVLEHLHNPFVAIQEIHRVLKPGGVYVGTVSQGEPFHDSYFHHTPWGFVSLVSSVAGLHIKRLWSSGDTLNSLSIMGRYPKVIKQLIRFVHKIHVGAPFLAPRKMKWSVREKMLDELYRAGSVGFVVRKIAANCVRTQN
jgi:SAM-dependent methyltransferase